MPTLIKHETQPLMTRSHRLSNGLRVIHQPAFDREVLSYQTWIPSGSGAEEVGEGGVAHLLEHLMFTGTDRFPEGELDRRLEALGGQANAATWLDWTFYHQDLPATGFEEIVELEADRLTRLSLDEERFQAEHQVVQNERRECVDDDPAGRMSELLWALAFGAEHPYGRPTIGWDEELRALSLEQCMGFYRAHYHPSRAIIVVSGAVEEERLLRAIEKRYCSVAGDTRGAPAATLTRPGPPARGGRRAIELPVATSRLMIGLPAPSACDPLLPAFEVLHQLLFEGDSSRLIADLLLDRGLVSSLYAHPIKLRGGGLYEISAELSPGASLAVVEREIFGALQSLAERGPGLEELEKAQRQLELDAWRSLQTVSQRAEGLGLWQCVAGDWAQLYQHPRRFEEVDAEAVRRCAERLCSSPGRAIMSAEASAEASAETSAEKT